MSVCQCLVHVCASLWCVFLCALGAVGRPSIPQEACVCVILFGACLWAVVGLGALYICICLGKWCALVCCVCLLICTHDLVILVVGDFLN